MSHRIARITTLLGLLTLTQLSIAGLHLSRKGHSLPEVQALRAGVINTQSNIEFWQTNYGQLFLDITITNGRAGTFWPRGSNFPYIFGGAFWLGTVKNGVRHVSVGYNPATGGSWFQPGTVNAAKAFHDSVKQATGAGRYPNEADIDYSRKFPVFSSTQYDIFLGRPLDPRANLPNWPIWDTSSDPNDIVGANHYFGSFVVDPSKRDTSVYPIHYVKRVSSRIDSVTGGVVVETTLVQKGGPAFVSEEDMFTVCNEMDTSYYSQKSSGRSYPLQLEVQRTIYSWQSTGNKDYIFIVYHLINKSSSVLDSCWLAMVADPDIGNATNDENGYYLGDTSLNLAMHWSDPEPNVPQSTSPMAYPGVLGFDFLESPAVYKKGDGPDSLIGTVKPGVQPNAKQLGLVRFKRWENGSDPADDDSRYAFMTGRVRDTALGQPSDKRLLMSTGPFKLLANQAAQIAVGVIAARDDIRGDANLAASMTSCVALDSKAQTLYDKQYRTDQPLQPSIPPLPPAILWTVGADHCVTLRWDSLAERSYDPYVTGFDFAGYRLYRGTSDLPGALHAIHEWKLSDLNPQEYQSLVAQIPSDNAAQSVRDAFYTKISHVMDSLTQHRTFTDIGDDDHNGTVSYAEQLLNDCPYVYRLVAFDQGDSLASIPSREGWGSASTAIGRPVQTDASLDTTYVVTSGGDNLGGISHFHWTIQNRQLLYQLLAGSTVTVTFQPAEYDLPQAYREYAMNLSVQGSRLDSTVTYHYKGTAFPSLFSAPFVYGSNVASYFLANDTTAITQTRYGNDMLPVNVIPSTGSLWSADTSFIPNQAILGTLSHSMDHRFLQMVAQMAYPTQAPPTPIRDTVFTKNRITGALTQSYSTHNDTMRTARWMLVPYHIGRRDTVVSGQRLPLIPIMQNFVNLNGDSVRVHHWQYTADTTIVGEDPFAVVSGTHRVAMYYENTSNTTTFDSAADMGQYDYIVQFSQGGVENDTIKNIPYTVPYLNVAIQAEQIYTVKDSHGNDSTVRTTSTCTPVAQVIDGQLQPAQFGIDQCLWKFSPSSNTDARRTYQWLGYRLNDPNSTHRSSNGLTTSRYYLTAHGIGTDDTTTIAFVNRFTVGGATCYFDSANKKINKFTPDVLPGQYLQPSTADFQPGDAVRIRYLGGMLGLPAPGATITTVFKDAPSDVGERGAAITGPLARVRMWPNPALADREALRFDEIPERCTISFFTVDGECLGRLEHAAGTTATVDLAHLANRVLGSELVFVQIATPDHAARTLRLITLRTP